MRPGFSDINAMADLMGALDDVDSGVVTQQVNQARASGSTEGLNAHQMNNAAMANILADLYSVAGDELNVAPVMPNAPQPQQPTTYNMMQDDMSYEEYLAQTQGKQLQAVDPLTGQAEVRALPQIPNGDEWVLIAESYVGVKSLNTHSIKNTVTGSIILDGITLKESAKVVCNMLNEGKMITDPKMLGIISSGVQYTYMVESMVKTLKQKSRVIRESNYDAAKQCDYTITEQKQKANSIKNDLLVYLAKHNITHK